MKVPRALQMPVFRLGCSLSPTCSQDLQAVLAVGSRMREWQQGQPLSGDTPYVPRLSQWHSTALLLCRHRQKFHGQGSSAE